MLGEAAEMTVRLPAAFETADGTYLRAEASGPADDPERIVAEVAEQIVAE